MRKDITEIIIDFVDTGNSKKELEEIIKSISFYKILSDNLLGSSYTYFTVILLSLIDYWKDFSSHDWLNLIQEKSQDAGALYNIFLFTYSFLGINFLDDYAKMKIVNEKQEKGLLNRFKTRPYELGIDENDYRLGDINVRNKLNLIQKRFLSEGRKSAEKVQKPKKIDGKYICKVPDSWEWAKII